MRINSKLIFTVYTVIKIFISVLHLPFSETITQCLILITLLLLSTLGVTNWMMRIPLKTVVACALVTLVSSLTRDDVLKDEMDELRRYVKVIFSYIFPCFISLHQCCRFQHSGKSKVMWWRIHSLQEMTQKMEEMSIEISRCNELILAEEGKIQRTFFKIQCFSSN